MSMIFSTKERHYKFFIFHLCWTSKSQYFTWKGFIWNYRKTIESFLEVLRLENHFFIELKCLTCLLKIAKQARNILYFRIHVHWFLVKNLGS